MTQRAWHDKALSPEARVSALMAEMTLEEKVAQLGSIWPGFKMTPDEASDEVETGADNVAPMQHVFEDVSWEDGTRNGLGHITRSFGTSPIEPGEGVKRLVDFQRRLVNETRLGIPATAHEECLTGFTTFRATVYPAPLAMAATWDEAIVEQVSNTIGKDMAAVGVHHALSPVLDVVRDYRWGRVEETMGEDPYVCSVMNTAYVKGLEKAGIVATLKHFFGHSASKAARNHAPVEMGKRILYDYLLPPFEMALREGGARSVMNSYTDIDGVPVASDPTIMNDLLRKDLEFEGVVVSDYWAISFLENMHRVAGSIADAGALALVAGIDVELPGTRCYGHGLVELVRSGKLPEHYVDRSLRRVLNQKLEQGLLDADYDPARGLETFLADPTSVVFDTDSNRALSRKVAEESVVLLQNNGVLPLKAPAKVAVIGPVANDPSPFLGCYSYPNHVMPRYPELGLGMAVPTLLDSLIAEFPGTEFSHSAGTPIKEADRSGIAAAVASAEAADLVILAVGDRAGLFGQGTSGEGCDAENLDLPGVQAELVEAVLAAGKPVVMVTVSGRPYAMGSFAQRADAMIQAFMPGEEAGSALAGVISGRVNPSGKLPVQIPATAYGQPSTYLQPMYGQPGLNISPVDSIPLFHFGHGLSYTNYEYSGFEIDQHSIGTDGSFRASLTVANTGSRAGSEIVQLYFEDPVAEVARPIQMLLGFTRLNLKPGQSAKVSFEVHTDRLAYHGRAAKRIIDAGEIMVSVGASSKQLEGTAILNLTGATREVPFNRILRTPATITFN